MMQSEKYGYGFIPEEFLPEGKDEFWPRNNEVSRQICCTAWRKINQSEIDILLQNGNTCSDWNNFLVSDPFDPSLIQRSNFYGLVRLGALKESILKHHDFCVPCGIRNSTVISCDIGSDTSIQGCAYISHYIIGDQCILSGIDEMQATNHTKFGNGVLTDGEDEDVRVWIDVMNEAGGRSILPFENMIPADALLWAAYRDDSGLVARLKQITQECYGGFRGRYGVIGSGSVIKSCAIIKDVNAGCHTYIKGANKLKNLTILSCADETTQIGEGVELVNGIVGYGCHIFYGSKAVRFVMGRDCNLKYGARLIHSVLGDNSTVSCCEILNNLIFPMHEQHHNNSFLVASLVQGMSNMAAGVTIGSNHNSRANDGEIRAGRGFWPGLDVSLKHSSCFASFIIIVKGEYPAELNIPFPFALVNNNVFKNRLEVMPAYFWMYNLYALERNSWKCGYRDRRVVKVQHIETGYLEPDTAEEIISAISLLETCIRESGLKTKNIKGVPCTRLERGRRDQVILKPLEALAAYRQMLRWYAVKTIAAFFDSRSDLDFNGLLSLLGREKREGRVKNWVNMGGQIVPAFRVDALRREITDGKYKNWDEIHAVYDQWHEQYPLDRACHAFALLSLPAGSGMAQALVNEFRAAIETSRLINSQILETRAKDFKNTFKMATFRNAAEMEKVLGKPENDSFIKFSNEKSRCFEEMIARVINQVIAPQQNADVIV